MDGVPVLLPLAPTAWDEATASRRIAQLEAALFRRNEQVDELHANLAELHESHAFRLAHLVSRFTDKLLPRHSRRRRALRSATRALVRGIGRAIGRNRPGTQVALDQFQYARWMAAHEPTKSELAKQRRATFARQPKISVVVPVYNPPAQFLEEMIESVRAQTYPHWELCLADASTQAHVRTLLERLARADSRIRLHELTDNRGIAGNTNAALAMATGNYIAFLDHDDRLAPWALNSVVDAINRKPTADFLFSDEDKLDEKNNRVDPCFKPGWSPDLLRTHNYVCHLLVLSRELVARVGGVREGFDGAQDYDLVLRASEQAHEIIHIPRVLYHWRLHPQSTAANTDSKQYLVEAGRKALADHLQRTGNSATVHTAGKPGMYRVAYHLREQPLVSAIIPNRDAPAMLHRVIESLEQSTYANFEVLVLENGSTGEDTFAYYRELARKPHVRVLKWERPFNYSAVNNFGAAHAQGEVLLFLNNDVQAIHPDWLEAMVSHAVRPEIGAVGAKLLFADGTVQHAGIVLGMGGVAGHAYSRFPQDAAGYLDQMRSVQNVAAVTGACLMTRRDVFTKAGGLDERFVLAYNDVDYGMRVRALGYRVLWTPEAELYHLESKTRGYEDNRAKQERFLHEFELFQRVWARELAAGDPFYNPNFRLDRADMALRA